MAHDKTNELDHARLAERLQEIAHDISNPLSVVMGNTQLLMELAQATGSDADFTDPLQDIKSAAGRMQQQIGQLNKLKDELAPPEQGKD